jgi:hypothetical protein
VKGNTSETSVDVAWNGGNCGVADVVFGFIACSK